MGPTASLVRALWLLMEGKGYAPTANLSVGPGSSSLVVATRPEIPSLPADALCARAGGVGWSMHLPRPLRHVRPLVLGHIERHLTPAMELKA